jgi:hypothetical protein
MTQCLINPTIENYYEYITQMLRGQICEEI